MEKKVRFIPCNTDAWDTAAKKSQRKTKKSFVPDFKAANTKKNWD